MPFAYDSTPLNSIEFLRYFTQDSFLLPIVLCSFYLITYIKKIQNNRYLYILFLLIYILISILIQLYLIKNIDYFYLNYFITFIFSIFIPLFFIFRNTQNHIKIRVIILSLLFYPVYFFSFGMLSDLQFGGIYCFYPLQFHF